MNLLTVFIYHKQCLAHVVVSVIVVSVIVSTAYQEVVSSVRGSLTVV